MTWRNLEREGRVGQQQERMEHLEPLPGEEKPKEGQEATFSSLRKI